MMKTLIICQSDTLSCKWRIQHNRRHFCSYSGCSSVAILAISFGLIPLQILSEEDPSAKKGDEESGIVGAIKSFFDPNEKVKSGKILPKAYLKSVREVLKALRESLNEDPNDLPKYRRNADAAKEAIHDYLSNWRGQQSVISEESNIVLEKAITSLATFYSNAGPSAPLPEELKSRVLDDLSSLEKLLL